MRVQRPRTGSGTKGEKVKSLEQKFNERVNRNGPMPTHAPELGPCWIWTAGKTDEGYGNFGLNATRRERKNIAAHRFSYQLLKGEIPIGLVSDHLCRNRACVNPSHLEIVDERTNILRGVGPCAVNAAKKFCIHGHEFTEENTYIWHGKRKCRTCHRRICRNGKSR